MFDGVVFEVDGVLVDSPHERAWREALEELMSGPWRDVRPLTRYAPARFDTTVYQTMAAGRTRDAGARALLDYFGVPDAEHRAAEYSHRKHEMVISFIEGDEFVAFRDAVSFMLALKASRVMVAAASASTNANMFLARVFPSDLGVPQHLFSSGIAQGAPLLYQFNANVCGREFKRDKPDPEIYLTAARELGVSPSACLVVEDAPAGVEAAKNGGMVALGIARSGEDDLLYAAGADLVVTSLDDVSLTAFAQGKLGRRSPTRRREGLLGSP